MNFKIKKSQILNFEYYFWYYTLFNIHYTVFLPWQKIWDCAIGDTKNYTMGKLESIIKHLRWNVFAKIVKNSDPGCFGGWYTLLLVTQTLVLKKPFFNFFFQFYVNKKYVK